MINEEPNVIIQAPDLPAGEFSAWLHRIRTVLKRKDGVDVPCGECTACCQSSYFIHIRPEETRTRARIPKKLLFPAPRLPKGTLLLGHDEYGCCPMFRDNHCSIYEDRPQTCRKYDCRIFPATGLPVDHDKVLLAQQARRWQFDFPTSQDHQEFRAVHAVAAFLTQQVECFLDGFVPPNTTQQAIVAIKVYEVFLNAVNEPDNREDADRNQEIASAIIAAYERFGAAD